MIRCCLLKWAFSKNMKCKTRIAWNNSMLTTIHCTIFRETHLRNAPPLACFKFMSVTRPFCSKIVFRRCSVIWNDKTEQFRAIKLSLFDGVPEIKAKHTPFGRFLTISRDMSKWSGNFCHLHCTNWIAQRTDTCISFSGTRFKSAHKESTVSEESTD